MTRALLIALCLLASLPALAQYEEDDDHEARDRRYAERQQLQKPATDPSEIGDPSAEFLELAEKLVHDRNYRTDTTARYRVQSDDPRLDATAAAQLLERFRDYFESRWPQDLLAFPYDKTSRVFLFYSFHKYNQLLGGDFRFSPIRPQGHYGSLYDAVALHSDPDGGASSTADALIHEATHQLVDQRIFGGKRSDAIWLTEGLASYFGYTFLDADGVFVTGELGGKSVAIFHGEHPKPGPEAKQRLREFHASAKAFRKASDRPLLEYLLEINDGAGFYGRNTNLNYSTAWLLVHLLLHGDDERYRDGFLSYLALEAEGAGGAATLFRELGLTAEELQTHFDKHVSSLKSH